jgi:UDP-N-acetyl-D-glucosamine/UDP-N-acetyl-D-galactosamine dehydrogenase
MPEVIERLEPRFEGARTDPALATVALVGLGYVGLPVAVAFGRQRPTIGYDLSRKRIDHLRQMVDPTGEVSTAELMQAQHFRPTAQPADLREADFIIVAVPTPVDAAHQPDFGRSIGAAETVGAHMKRGATVSTSRPSIPARPRRSACRCSSGTRACVEADFHVGYSPERINPGDKEHT